MSYQTFVVISPKGMFTQFVIDETDTIEHFLGAYSVSKVKNHPVAFSNDGVQGEYNWVASRWIGKPFYGALIILNVDGKPFPGCEEAWKVTDEIYDYLSEVSNAGK